MSRFYIAIAATAAVVLASAVVVPAKDRKPKDQSANEPAAAPAAAPAVPATPVPVKVELPADLNIASLQVQAIDTLYQLDLSVTQLQALRTAAAGAASAQKREPAPDKPKLASTMTDLANALVNGHDDEEIAKLRNQFSELAGDETNHLDDDVDATTASRPKAADFAKHLNAGQIAAYLASHADQITDPTEIMISVLASIHDAENQAEADSQIKDVSEQVGWLVAGSNGKAGATTSQVAAWFKDNRERADADHDLLEASAKKVIGETPPMDVLSHWIDNSMAELISNPQLVPAVNAMLKAKGH